jgi:hypothetical protein
MHLLDEMGEKLSCMGCREEMYCGDSCADMPSSSSMALEDGPRLIQSTCDFFD